MSSALISPDSIIRSFPEPPGKVHLLYGGGEIFPFSLTMAAHALQKGMPIAVVDGANRFDVHLLARFARERRMDPNEFLRRIYISRGFTCYQMEQAIVGRLPAFLHRIGSSVAMVFGLLDTFYDEQAPLREVQQILTRVLAAFGSMKADGTSLLVVCREQRVAPEERNRLFTRLKSGVDGAYRMDGEQRRLTQEVRRGAPMGITMPRRHMLAGRKEVSRRGAESAKAAEERIVLLEPVNDSHKPVSEQGNVKVDENA